MPEAPGIQVHAGFGEQSGSVEIIGKCFRYFAHGVVIGLGGLAAIGLGIGGKTQRHGPYVGLFGRRSVGREIHSLLDGGMGRRETLVAGGIVVVGADCFRHSPIGHRQFGIELRRALKRARCFVVIEGVNLAQPLIKKLLGLRIAGRDRVMKVAIAGHQGGRLRLRVRGMVLRHCQTAHRKDE